MSIESINVAFQIGLLYAIAAVAVMLAFRIIGFPDLTPDGSFIFGSAVGAIILLHGWSNFFAIPAAIFAGACSGILTALLHTRLRISKLLSSILVMTMLYSVSLRTMSTSNLSLMDSQSFMSSIGSNINKFWSTTMIAVLVGLIIILVWMFLKTQLGLRLRAAGDSESALEQRGICREPLYIIGLAIANGLAGLAGLLISQYQGFVDISMGTGLVIVCLASIIIGETVLRPEKVSILLLTPIIGMVVYQCVIAIALQLGMSAADLKITTAIITLAFVALDRLRVRTKKGSRQIGNRNI